MAIDLVAWDLGDHLKTPEDVAGYLDVAFEDEGVSGFLEALGHVARARGSGISDIAKRSGVSRPALSHALTSAGHPDIVTVVAILKEMGVEIRFAPMKTPADAA